MTTTAERSPNLALSGSELREIILRDFIAMLEQDGMLMPHLAYKRVAYDLRLRLHLDNIIVPTSIASTESKPVGGNVVAKQPQLAAIEAPPLEGESDQSKVSGSDLSRLVESPNSERLRTGLPVPVMVRQNDGTMVEERVKYPTSGEEGQVTHTPVSAEQGKRWVNDAKHQKGRK